MENQENLQNSGFRFRSEVLVEAIDGMRTNPPEALVKFKAAHPVHKNTKGYSCALFADYFQIAESTLRKLKYGQIANPVCFTLWQFWVRGLDPLALLGIPHAKECNEKQCTADMRVMQQRLDTKDAHIADLVGQLEKEQAETARLRKRVLKEARALTGVSVALVIVFAVALWLLYKVANPGEGIFQAK